jgi:hypothetical protein
MAVVIDSVFAPVCNRLDRPVMLSSSPLIPGPRPDGGPTARHILVVNQGGRVLGRVIAAVPDWPCPPAVIPPRAKARGLTAAIHLGRTAPLSAPRA